MSDDPFLETDRHLGGGTTVLVGTDGGRYPAGNSVVVQGADRTVLIDPSVSVHERGGSPVPIDHVVCSHGHEDHVVALDLYPSSRVWAHDDDVHALQSLDGLMAIYGMDGDADAAFRHEIVTEFHYSARPDAEGFGDGHVFDLGGGVSVTAIHLPGHTRGHAGFVIEPGGIVYLADIDLTGFGPYYGDVWSDLEQFVESLRIVRELDARWYVTYHQKGIVDGRETFLSMLDAYESVIPRRDAAMLEFLSEPRTLDEMVAHRFVYRPHVELTFADSVERRTAEMHLARLQRWGQVAFDGDRWHVVS
ncbi:MAG: MBL fold metallo-hydrolase [Actinomycetota bacterium]